jgi:hypothetical protein
MKRVTVDASLPEMLPFIPEPVELCDARGHVLGVYTPDPTAFENLDPGISEDELARREAEPGGRQLAEILADLERRG